MHRCVRALAVLVIAVVAGCPGGDDDDTPRLDARPVSPPVQLTIVVPCTTDCPRNTTIDAMLRIELGAGSGGTATVTPTLTFGGSLGDEHTAGIAALTLAPGETVMQPFDFECNDVNGGTLTAAGSATDSLGSLTVTGDSVEIRSPGSTTIDPATADMRGYIELVTYTYPGRAYNGSGAVYIFKESGTLATRGAFRDQVLSTPLTPANQCRDEVDVTATPEEQTLTALPTFPAADGGGALTFFMAGPSIIADGTNIQPGRRFDAEIAAQIEFDGVQAPNLVRIPPAITSTSGTAVLDGNLMGYPQPGRNLGQFPAATTTLPTISWTAPATPITNAHVRIIDRRIGAAGNPGTRVIYCGIDPTATSWTMPQATFTSLDPSNPSSQSDLITIDLAFDDVRAAPSGEGAFVSATTTMLSNFFLQKVP